MISTPILIAIAAVLALLFRDKLALFFKSALTPKAPTPALPAPPITPIVLPVGKPGADELPRLLEMVHGIAEKSPHTLETADLEAAADAGDTNRFLDLLAQLLPFLEAVVAATPNPFDNMAIAILKAYLSSRAPTPAPV